MGVALVAGGRTGSAQQAEWESISGPDGRYRLTMPNGFHRSRVAGHGATVHSYVTLLPGRFVLEFVDVSFDNPHSIPQGAALAAALEQMQGGMQKSFPGATLVEQGPMTTGPLAGREFVLSTDGGNRFVRVRLYLTPTAVYTATVQGPVAERQNPMIGQFLESIQFG
jgi:hypothetical protein